MQGQKKISAAIPHYVMLSTNQTIALIILDDTATSNKNLKILYDNQPDDPDFDNIEKKYIQSLMNKSKKDLIEIINSPKKYSR